MGSTARWGDLPHIPQLKAYPSSVQAAILALIDGQLKSQAAEAKAKADEQTGD